MRHTPLIIDAHFNYTSFTGNYMSGGEGQIYVILLVRLCDLLAPLVLI